MRIAYLVLLTVCGCARRPIDDGTLVALDGAAATPGDGGFDAAGSGGGDGGKDGGASRGEQGGGGDGRGGAEDGGSTGRSSDSESDAQSRSEDAGPCGSTDTDLRNCGACGNECPAAATSCQAGLCQFQGCTWHAYDGDDYLFCYSKTGQNWDSARSFCQALDMDLTVIETAEENTFVAMHAVSAWIGATDLDADGDWRWIVPGGARKGQAFWNGRSAIYGGGTGISGVFSDWTSTDPSGNPGEDCASLLSSDWWDDACWSEHGLVCEIVRPAL